MKKIMLSMVAVAIAFSTSHAQESKQTAPATQKPAAAPQKAEPQKGAPDKAAPEKKAPTPPNAEKRTERYMAKLSEQYALTEEQKPKVNAIVLKREQTRDELRTKFADDNKAFNEANRKLMTDAEKEIKALVTPEQMENKKKYDEAQRQRNKEAAEKRAKQNPPPAPPAAPEKPKDAPPAPAKDPK